MKNKIYCFLEHSRFSEKAFRHDPDGSLHDPLIHETKNPHYAKTGIPIRPAPIPGIYGPGGFDAFRSRYRFRMGTEPPGALLKRSGVSKVTKRSIRYRIRGLKITDRGGRDE